MTKETEKSGDQAAPAEGQLHPAPSMLWFAIPIGLLFAYALLTR